MPRVPSRALGARPDIRTPLTLTEAEWRSSVDVFAMEHADILQRHKILFSAPPFDLVHGITVSRRDLRLQLEYEALGMLLRLRGRVLTSDHGAAERIETLVSGTSQVLVVFRAILRLRDEVPPADGDELCRRAASVAGFDAAPFVTVLAQWRGGKSVDAGNLDDVLEELPRRHGAGGGLSGRAPPGGVTPERQTRLNPRGCEIRCIAWSAGQDQFRRTR